MARSLITGITGFAGSHLASHLLHSDDGSSDPSEAKILGCSRYGRWPANVPESLRQIPLVTGEIDEIAQHRNQIAQFRPDWIFHLAALSFPADCGADEPSEVARRINVEGTRAVLELANSLAHSPRVVVASSSYVYAPVTADHYLVTEEYATKPKNGYGKSKLAAENEVLEATERWGIKAVIARSFNHTGPRQSARMMLPEWVYQFAAGHRPVRVYSLNSFLDLTDVRDVVRAYAMLAERGTTNSIYNVGSGVCRRSGDVFAQLRQMADPQRPFVEISSTRRQHPIADLTRIRGETGWEATIPLEQTIENTWAFWRMEKDG